MVPWQSRTPSRRCSPVRRSASLPRAGFTAIELAVVVVLLGLMFALALPKVRVDSTAVDTAARTISLAIMTAQRDAVSRGHNVLVTFDAAEHTTMSTWDLNNNGLAEDGEKRRPFLVPETVRFGRPASVPGLDGDLSDPGESVTLILQRNGAVSRARIIYLTSARALAGGEHTDARALRITRATGRPVWFAWTGTEWRQGS
jgi:prepilin-type N-terminal cleavage/methylation domain-containing protein